MSNTENSRAGGNTVAITSSVTASTFASALTACANCNWSTSAIRDVSFGTSARETILAACAREISTLCACAKSRSHVSAAECVRSVSGSAAMTSPARASVLYAFVRLSGFASTSTSVVSALTSRAQSPSFAHNSLRSDSCLSTTSRVS